MTPLALLGAQTHSLKYNRSFPAGPKVIDIEVTNGPLRLIASNTNTIQIGCEIELRAPTVEDLELAKGEVKFEPRVDGDALRIWMENPQQHRWNRYSYKQTLDVEFPASMRPLVRGVNGPIHITYKAPPQRDLYVRNVNGEIELEFATQPNADFQMKNLNGHIYSAWDMTALPVVEETQVTDKGMKRIVSRNRYSAGRIGRGGILVQIESTNGDIRIVERKA